MVVEPLRSTAYLGPDKGRWGPATWSDVVEAAAGGLLDETHWVDLKQELATGKATINTDLAKDLASLAVDGGLLVIGIEDHNSHAGKVCGVELAGLADRVDQIARDKVRPSLVVRSVEVADPDHDGRGCLLVHIPPSAQAPHMVEYVYYGRGDKVNIRLSDEQVRSIFADRARAQQGILADLRQMAEDDPMSEEDRKNGHLYLLARPDTASDEALVDFLARNDAHQAVLQMLHHIRMARGDADFAPDLHRLPNQITRAEGHAFTTVNHQDRPYEDTMLDLLIREDGGIRLTCGRGTDFWHKQTFPEREPTRAVIPMLVLGVTQSFAAFAGQLADQHAAYQGQWKLGIRMDRLRGSQPLDTVQNPFEWPGHPYTRDDYERITMATTEQLVNTPRAVADQLVMPLLRGLGVAARYAAITP
jgi:hypothetical protein